MRANQSPGPHIRTGLNAMWKLYYAPNHALMRAELEIEFGVLENHFGLYCRRVAEELGANDPDALALVNSSQDENGFEVLTLKPSVVTAINASPAFTTIGCGRSTQPPSPTVVVANRQVPCVRRKGDHTTAGGR